ncbi:TAXI family TRAP transporter solute-binding subunit [Bradyrhizobium ontarionense]|uniref:TAXI family TRAP transporter solute-binding subunit n=1 Tax=Bradyrhizobium ontarionense TaxID=2898149 RepID=A0ABY3RHK7_9BRAD|nr:TAXI family TRAP transporter solute-binding subunit [Bradyrhizobium sp. A19]UFZ06970.1 TAXI family TRAP transporter solute-binding subunit [Bradyrhizobium sp. A19]
MPDPVAVKDSPAPRRRRRFPKLLALATFLSFVTVALAIGYWLWQPATLRIAVGPAGGDDDTLVRAMAEAFDTKDDAVRLVPIATDGPLQSTTLLANGQTDLAVARGDLQLPPTARSMAILRRNLLVLWSASSRGSKPKSDSRVKSIADLAGRRLGVIGASQVNVALLRVVLGESGVNPDKVAVVQFGVNQVADMTADMTLDAFAMVGALNDKTIADAITATARRRGEPRFLAVDVSEAIAERHPLYESDEIPTGAFGTTPQRPDDKVETVGVNQLIIAAASLPEDTAGTFTRQLFTVKAQLAKTVPSAAKIQKPDTDKDAALPAHPGAAAYIDNNERSFLDKYSDYLWGAVLVLSGLGSAAAWLRHYLKRDERMDNTDHRDRLLSAIATARQAQTPAELDQMQCEADAILRETLACHDDGAIEDGDLTAFNLVLIQFHEAVASRRAMLAADGQRSLAPVRNG